MKTFGALVFVMMASSGLAENTPIATVMQKNLELPAHRSLQSVMSDPKTEMIPFETDGCSGGMSWSWRVVADLFPDFEQAQGAQPPWEDCCIVHDRAYYDAGNARDAETSFEARLAADNALLQCVAQPSNEEVNALAQRYGVPTARIRFAYEMIAGSMFNAVRFGGGPCSGLPWRWGFGYPGCVPGF